MDEVLSLGSGPCLEELAQTKDPDYASKGLKQCRAWIRQLERTFGPFPETLELQIARCPHDFGFYYDVVAVFDPEDPEAVELAYRMEEQAPTRWDAEASKELGISRKSMSRR